MASHFVELLGADQRAALRRLVVGLVLVCVLAAPAYFLYPWQGVVAHFAAAVVGLLVGTLVAGRRSRAFEASLKGTWAQWMRFAPSCETVGEIHRKVQGRSGRNKAYVWAAVLTVLWALEIGLLALALSDTKEAVLALPVLGFNGLLAGALLGHAARMRSWTREFKRSVSEMVDAGEIGVWGVL